MQMLSYTERGLNIYRNYVNHIVCCSFHSHHLNSIEHLWETLDHSVSYHQNTKKIQ